MGAIDFDDDLNSAPLATQDTEPNFIDGEPTKENSELDSFYIETEVGKKQNRNKVKVTNEKAAVKIMRSSAKAFAYGDQLDKEISRVLR